MPENKSELPRIVKDLPIWVKFLVAPFTLITTVVGFIQLFQDNTGLVTTTLLVLGIGGILAFLAYITFAKKASLLAVSRDAQSKYKRLPKRIRRLAIAALILIIIFTARGVGYNLFSQEDDLDQFVILIADFNGPDPKSYRVTETILSELNSAAEKHSDIHIEALDQTITEAQGSSEARAIGEQRGANLVIWGWYGVTAETVPLKVNYELLQGPDPEYTLGFCSPVDEEVQLRPVTELESFVLQARLADQLTYLSLFTVGIIRYSTEDWAEAILLFNDALDKHPKPDSLLMTSNIRLYRGIAYENAELYKEAAEDFTKFLEGVPIHATAFAHRAHVYYQQDKLEEALADNEKVIQIDPDNARAYFNRAIILQDLGEFEESIDSLSKAADLKENFCVYVRRSYSFMKIGDYEAASEDVERALEFRSDSAIIYYYQGRVYQGQNELESAVESFTLAIKFDREFSDAYNGRGIAYANSGEIDKAIADYTSAIAIKEDATYYYNRGLAFQNTDQLKPALRDFSEAISLDSNNPVYRLSRAFIYLDLEETDSALIDLQQYLALAPDAENREDIEEVIEELEQQITD